MALFENWLQKTREEIEAELDTPQERADLELIILQEARLGRVKHAQDTFGQAMSLELSEAVHVDLEAWRADEARANEAFERLLRRSL